MPINRALAKQWTDAGYKPGMASAWVTPPPPNNLLRVYHLTSVEFAISDVALGRMKVSRFADSNDPFELMAFTFDDRRSRDLMRSFKDRYDQDKGLLCFSSNWNSPVLWSHYAARHKGVCLGFNVEKDDALKVQYADSRLRNQVTKIRNEEDIDGALREILICTKFKHWEYEQEVRIEIPLNQATREGSNYFFQFDDRIHLVEVILGPLCEIPLLEMRTFVSSIYPDAVTYQSRLAINSFSIVVQEKTVP